MTSPFAAHSSGGAYLKPADMNGHLVIITNVVQDWPTQYDTLRKADVEVASFQLADLHGSGEWEQVKSNYAGVNNKLGNVRGKPGQMVLGRIGQARTTGGYDAWVLAEYSSEDEAYAVNWLASNPAPSAFAAPSAPAAPQGLPPAPPAAQAFATGAPVPTAAAPPAAAPVAAPAQQFTPEQLAAMMASLQAPQG